MKTLIITLLFGCAPLLSACGTAGARPATDTARVAQTNDLQTPQVPDSIFDPVDRADYVLLHFWDSISPQDERMIDAQWLERNFATYAAQFLYASDYGIDYAVSTLLTQTAAYPDQIKDFARLAHKYLYQRDAETFNPKAFGVWLKYLADTPALADSDRTRYRYMLQALTKNSPGSKAADFTFTTRDGRQRSLHSLTTTPWTLLIFYDPDCETCHDIIERVRNDRKLTGPVRAGQVRVLLVDVADDVDAFRNDAATLPPEWVVGFDTTRVEDNDIYIFDTTPAIYLLDREGKVMLKDATIDELTDFARSKAGEL